MRKLVLLAVVLAGALAGLRLVRGPERSRGGTAGAGAVRAHEDRPERAVAPPALVAAEPAPPEAHDAARVPVGTGGADPGPAREPEEPTAFHGLVVDARTGEPLAGACAWIEEAPASVPAGDACTGSDGRFTLRRDPEQALALGGVRAAGYGLASLVVDARHDAPERAALVELLPEGGLEVRVHGAHGQPLADVAVRVLWHSDPIVTADAVVGTSARARWEEPTDAAGIAFLRGLPAETVLDWEVRDEVGAAQEGQVALVAGEVRVLDVALGDGAVLAGRVVDEAGAPVPALEVTCTRVRLTRTHAREPALRTVSDDAGRFVLDELALGDYVLGVERQRELLVDERTRVVALERARVEHELRVRRGHFLAGRVTGEPDLVAGLSFAIALAAGGERRSASVERGSFRIGPLDAGEYEVFAVGAGGGTARVRTRAGDEEIELAAVPPLELPVRIEGADGPFEILVTDLDSGILTLWSEDAPRFTAGLAPGRYALVASAPGDRIGCAAPVVSAASAPEVVLELAPAARVTVVHRAADRTRGIVLRHDGRPYPVRGAVGPPLAPGAARAVTVPPGRVAAELVEDGRVVAREERYVAPGERVRIELVPR